MGLQTGRGRYDLGAAAGRGHDMPVRSEERLGYVVGIDLGTTFTAAAVGRDSAPTMVTLEHRSTAVPSVVFTAPDGQTSYMMVLRTKASDVEEHSRWDDLIIVRSGKGSVEIGPKTNGARVLAPGELRGGTITAPSRLELRTGDIARIPAGVPHSFIPDEAEPWEFLLLKVRRPTKPLKRAPGHGK